MIAITMAVMTLDVPSRSMTTLDVTTLFMTIWDVTVLAMTKLSLTTLDATYNIGSIPTLIVSCRFLFY